MLHTLACHDTYAPSIETFFVLAKTAGMAAIPAGLLVVGWVRNARNRKLTQSRLARGECTACGYPLGVHDRCTECGVRVDRDIS